MNNNYATHTVTVFSYNYSNFYDIALYASKLRVLIFAF